MFSWLPMVSPGMLALGLAAISIPIIIHLLNRRRFKIVNWAAMEFLLDADKKNRRRVRLENLILLMLRCLAMLLLGLILARPFLDPQMLQGLMASPRFERIVVLDDSLSMQMQSGNESSLDRARGNVEQLLQQFLAANGEDTLTLFVTSRPGEPVISNEPVTGDSLDTLKQRISEIEPTDEVARFGEVLQTVDRYVHGEKQNVNRIVYVFSDFRSHDWYVEGETDNPNAPNNLIQSIGDRALRSFLVDVGAPMENNLTITSVLPDGTLNDGWETTFRVRVANNGLQTAEDVRVRLRIGDNIPLERVVDSIPPGSAEEAAFEFKFENVFDQELDMSNVDAGDPMLRESRAIKVLAEVSVDDELVDQFIGDNQGYYAAEVFRGVRVLIVDGDPSSDLDRSESIFISRALSPPGDERTGILVNTNTDIEFETTPLTDYDVIILCDVREMTATRVEQLENWVMEGGGLVIMPGDQTIASFYNEQLFAEGKGLSPFSLTEILGDVDEQTWANFEVEDPAHFVADLFHVGDGKSFSDIKVFSWWGTALAKPQSSGEGDGGGLPVSTVADKSGSDGDETTEGDAGEEDKGEPALVRDNPPAVLVRLNDPDNTAAVVEKKWGRGSVIAFAIPADRIWHNWPDHPSLAPIFCELVRTYLAGDLSGRGWMQVGEPISRPIDLAQVQRNVSVKDPLDETYNIEATPLGEASEEDAGTIWQVNYDNVRHRGFYELTLTGNDEQDRTVLLAANVDAQEGDMKRFEPDAAGRGFFGENARFLVGDEVVTETGDGTQSELWFVLLFVLAGVLATEQFLGWWFGRGR